MKIKHFKSKSKVYFTNFVVSKWENVEENKLSFKFHIL